MEVVYRRCGGIDVHKGSISVCVLLMEEEGAKKQVRRFGTMTGDLLELSQWLQQLGVTHVAMGVDRSLLETSVESVGGAVRTTAGQCSAHQASAWAKDGHS
jgi:hypothetical protein